MKEMTITNLTRPVIDGRLVHAARAHSATNRLRADIDLEYRAGSPGRTYALKLLEEIEGFNDAETTFLEDLASTKEREDGRGNMSLAEMELRREADLKAWDARIARKKARMAASSRNVTQFVERRKDA